MNANDGRYVMETIRNLIVIALVVALIAYVGKDFLAALR